jgi:4-nitrophenyl phosphatase
MIQDYLTDIKGLIIDMDGVLWHDTEPLGNLPVIFDSLKSSGYKIILATNNATRTIDEYHQKLRGFGVTLEDWQVINAAQAVGIYLSQRYPKSTHVYVVGEPSLKATMESYGFVIAKTEDVSELVKIVVASLDYQINYQKLRTASLLVQAGCEFIGSNPDVTLPTPDGFIPGSGTIIGAIEIAAGKKARIIGKPEPILYRMAMERLEVSPEHTLAIGDRLETDIAGAQAAGIHTALVLSGASTTAQAETWQPQPEIIVKHLTELVLS